MMCTKSITTALFVILFATFTTQVSAGLSEDKAAVVVGNKRTHALIAEKDFEGALRNAESTYTLSYQKLGEKNPNTAVLAEEYARLLGMTGNRIQALELYQTSVAIYASNYGENSLNAVQAILGVGEFSAGQEQPNQVKRALDILRSQAPDDQTAYAEAALYAGEYLVRSRSNRNLARKILGEALKIYEIEYGKKSTQVIQPLLLLASASADFGETVNAKSYYRRVLKIAQSKLSVAHQAELYRKAGTALLNFSGSVESKRYLKKGHQLAVETHGENHPRTAVAALSLARYHMADNKHNAAVSLLKDALSIIESDPNYRNHQRSVLTLLVKSYEAQGLSDEATPYCQAIGKISPWTETQDYLPIYKKAPVYPRNAVSARSEGYVIVKYTVDEYGFVKNPEITEATGHNSFKAASMTAVDEFRYAPAYVDGKPVPIDGVRNKFTFELR